MKLSLLVAVIGLIYLGAYAGCPTQTCAAEGAHEQSTELTLQGRIDEALKDLRTVNAYAFESSSLQSTEDMLERVIENALKDLHSATVRTLMADPERLNEVLRKSGIDRR